MEENEQVVNQESTESTEPVNENQTNEAPEKAEAPKQAAPPVAAKKRGALRDAILAVMPPRQQRRPDGLQVAAGQPPGGAVLLHPRRP